MADDAGCPVRTQGPRSTCRARRGTLALSASLTVLLAAVIGSFAYLNQAAPGQEISLDEVARLIRDRQVTSLMILANLFALYFGVGRSGGSALGEVVTFGQLGKRRGGGNKAATALLNRPGGITVFLNVAGKQRV